MPFASVYPAYVKKAERKGRTQAEVDEVMGEIRTALLEADVNVGVALTVDEADVASEPAPTAVTA